MISAIGLLLGAIIVAAGGDNLLHCLLLGVLEGLLVAYCPDFLRHCKKTRIICGRILAG